MKARKTSTTPPKSSVEGKALYKLTQDPAFWGDVARTIKKDCQKGKAVGYDWLYAVIRQVATNETSSRKAR